MNWTQSFQNFSTQAAPQKSQLQLSQEEVQFYQQIYQQLDPTNSGSVNGKISATFFKKSNLPVETLKQIWLIASSNGSALDHSEFNNALRLIAYAQNNIEVSERSLQQNIPVRLPRFSSVNDQQPPQQHLINSQVIPSDTRFDLQPEVFQKYMAYYQTIDTQGRGHVTGVEAKSLFSKSQLNNEILKHIWALCDIGNKGFLYQGEFIIALHLIGLAKKGLEAPHQLPDNLISILKQYKAPISPIQQQTFQFSDQQISSPQPPIDSNKKQNDLIDSQPPDTQTTNQLQSQIRALSQQSNEQKRKLKNSDWSSALQQANDQLREYAEEKQKEIEFLNTVILNYEQLLRDAKDQTSQYTSLLRQLETQRSQQFQHIEELTQNLTQQIAMNQQLRNQLATQVQQAPLLKPIQQQPTLSMQRNFNDFPTFQQEKANRDDLMMNFSEPIQQSGNLNLYGQNQNISEGASNSQLPPLPSQIPNLMVENSQLQPNQLYNCQPLTVQMYGQQSPQLYNEHLVKLKNNNINNYQTDVSLEDEFADYMAKKQRVASNNQANDSHDLPW